MERANVISVNPGVKTLGELNIDQFKLAEISRSLTAPGHESHVLRDTLSFVTGMNVAGRRNSRPLLYARICAAAVFALLAATSTASSLCVLYSVMAFSLATGTLLRPISAISASALLWSAFASLGGMEAIDTTVVLAASATLTFMFIGAGRISADRWIFKLLTSASKKRKEASKQPDSPLDYRAYRLADRRLR